MLGPLFNKELLEAARRPRNFLARIVVGLAMLGVFIICAAPYSGTFSTAKGQDPIITGPVIVYRVAGSPGGFSFPNQNAGMRLVLSTAVISEIGKSLFNGWAILMAAAVALIVPVLVCGLIAEEKDNRTYEVLLTTCLSDGEILLGKLASRLFMILFLLLSSFPIVGLASMYGGFSTGQLLIVELLAVECAALAAAIGLYFSTTSQKPYVALIKTYFALMILWWFVPILIPALEWQFTFTNVTSFLAVYSPWNLVSTTLEGNQPQPTYWGNATPTPKSWFDEFLPKLIAFSATYFTLALALLLRTAAILRRHALPVGDPLVVRILRRIYAALVGGARSFVENRQQAGGFSLLWRAEIASRSISRRVGALCSDLNPVAFRNFIANVYDPEKYIAQVQSLAWIGVLVFLFAGAYLQNALFSRQIIENILFVEVVILTMCGIVLSGASFTREKQTGSWELLLLTPITPAEIISATIIGILRTLFPVVVLVLLTAYVCGAVFLADERVAWTLVAIFVVLLEFIVAGLIVSLTRSRISSAIQWSFVIAALTCLAVFFTPNFEYTMFASVYLGIALLTVFMCMANRKRALARVALLATILVPVFIAGIAAFVNNALLSSLLTGADYEATWASRYRPDLTDYYWSSYYGGYIPIFEHILPHPIESPIAFWSLALSIPALLVLLVVWFDRLAGRATPAPERKSTEWI